MTDFKRLYNINVRLSKLYFYYPLDNVGLNYYVHSGPHDRGDRPPTLDQLRARRRRLWSAIMKREIGKAGKARNYNQKEKLANCKRVSNQCMKAVRSKATQSQRAMKETVWRAKRLTREMQVSQYVRGCSSHFFHTSNPYRTHSSCLSRFACGYIRIVP